VIAGLVELPGLVFARRALVGTLLRTPALVLLTAIVGDTFVRWISRLVGSVWMADVVAAVVIVVLLRSVRATRSHALVLADAPGS
jgi:membrane protein DedA with SNARE-associated domain